MRSGAGGLIEDVTGLVNLLEGLDVGLRLLFDGNMFQVTHHAGLFLSLRRVGRLALIFKESRCSTTKRL